MWNPAAAFYLEDVTDAGLTALAQHAPRLSRLALLRCSRVGDAGLAAVARSCRQLTSLQLADCPGLSERALVEVRRCLAGRLAGRLAGLPPAARLRPWRCLLALCSVTAPVCPLASPSPPAWLPGPAHTLRRRPLLAAFLCARLPSPHAVPSRRPRAARRSGSTARGCGRWTAPWRGAARACC
jgi:hypothetical protein